MEELWVLETVVELETIKEFGDFSSTAFFTIGILPAVYYFEDLWQNLWDTRTCLKLGSQFVQDIFFDIKEREVNMSDVSAPFMI